MHQRCILLLLAFGSVVGVLVVWNHGSICLLATIAGEATVFGEGRFGSDDCIVEAEDRRENLFNDF